MAAQTKKSNIGLIGLAVMGQVRQRSRRRRRPAVTTRPPPPAAAAHLIAPVSRRRRRRSSRPGTHFHPSTTRPQNLALNVAEKGFDISVYNRSGDKTDAAVARAQKEGVGARLHGYHDLKDFVQSLERPR